MNEQNMCTSQDTNLAKGEIDMETDPLELSYS